MEDKILAYGFSEGEGNETAWSGNFKLTDPIPHQHHFYAAFGHCINKGNEYFFSIVYGSQKPIKKESLTSFFVKKIPNLLAYQFKEEFHPVNVYSLSVGIITKNRKKKRSTYSDLLDDTNLMLAIKVNSLRNELFSELC